MAKLDRLETLITASASHQVKSGPRSQPITALDAVLDISKRAKQGVGFAEIQAKTGFGEKKIRNVIFRLHKTGKIKRVSRGIYTAA
jgi:predicted transcriptional regulator of viral defense system